MTDAKAEPGEIAVRFRWDEDLLREHERMCRARRPGDVRRRLGIVALAILLFMLIENEFALLEWKSSALLLGGMLAGLAIAVTAAMRFIGPWRRRRYLRGSPHLQGEILMRIGAAGVEATLPHVFSRYGWAVVTDVSYTPKAIGLALGPYAALALPADALDRSIPEAMAAIADWRASATSEPFDAGGRAS